MDNTAILTALRAEYSRLGQLIAAHEVYDAASGRKRRGRPPGKLSAVAPIRLSKNGKRLGRPLGSSNRKMKAVA
jgi:hypothetical protein